MSYSNTASSERVLCAGLVCAMAVAGTMAFSCAAPHAALIALAVLCLPRGQAFMLIGAGLALYQLTGWSVLHWDFSAASLLITLRLAVAAAVTAAAVMAVQKVLRGSSALRLVGSLMTAFAVYEVSVIALFSFPSLEKISLQDYLYMFYLNGLTFAGLLVLQAAFAPLLAGSHEWDPAPKPVHA